MRKLNVTVRNDFVVQDDRIVYKVFKEGGSEHYNIRLYVDGSDNELDKIESVQYILHPGFVDPIRMSENRDENFAIEIWTYGMFDIEVSFYLEDGSAETLHYYLTFSLPEDTGDNYIQL